MGTKIPNILSLIWIFGITSPWISSASGNSPNSKAPKGGVITVNLMMEPTSLHPIMAMDVYATKVRSYLADSLAVRDPETYEWVPRVAEKWDISKDGKVFTFYLRKGVLFHDEKEVTADDVKFSFEAIFEPKHEATYLRPYFEGIDKIEVVDKHTVKVIAKDTYFKNFDMIAMMEILPRSVYGDINKSRKLTREYHGCGPYVIEKYERGQMLVLRRFAKWYGWNTPQWKGAYNFDRVQIRFVKDEEMVLQMLEKGEIDYVDPDQMRLEVFAKKAVGPAWGKTVLKKKVENLGPKKYEFIGWNLRKEIFQDRNVRLALYHLLNRPAMIKKFLHDLAEPTRGPFANSSAFASPKIKNIEYDPKKAKALLAKAGWKDEDKNGVLEKILGGRTVELRFHLTYAYRGKEKFWTMYREDLRRAGVDMELRYLEWSSFLKTLDDNMSQDAKGQFRHPPTFDAITMAWGGGDLAWDPKQIWHSTSIKEGGSNFVAYKNAEVDRLIDDARYTLDRSKRQNLLRRVYEKISQDAPYAFLFNEKYEFYAVSSRIQQPAETFKYSVGGPFSSIGADFWWAKAQ